MITNELNPEPLLFINYRSEDTGSTASRLYTELAREFGADRVFLDHERIEAGANWPGALRSKVETSNVMFVLIGPHWLTARDTETGDRRLNIPEDWVRQEIETALKTNKTIIPILINEARPICKRDLRTVPSIQSIAELQTLPLRRKDWEGDFARIIECMVDVGFTRTFSRSENQAEPKVMLVLDRVKPHRRIQGGQSVMYGTATLADGTTAFGEGLSIQMTLENRSPFDIVITLVDLIIEDYDPHPPEDLEYPVLQDSGLHLEVPGSTRSAPLQLTALEKPGSSVPVTNSRLLLRSSASIEAQHTLNFSVVAKAPGIWTVKVQAHVVDAARLFDPQHVESDAFHIVKN